LVERVKTILLITLVERIVDDSASSASAHLLEGSIGSTTGASNEGNNTNNNTSNDTSSKTSDNNDTRRKSAFPVLLYALTLLFSTSNSTAIFLINDSIIAAQRLVVATLESNANSDCAEETIIRAWQVLSNASIRSAEVVVATILNVASYMVGSVDAISSRGVAGIIGTANAVTANFLGGLTSTSLVIASRGDAEIVAGTGNRSMHASAIDTRVNGTSIVVITVHRNSLATKSWVASGGIARPRIRAIGSNSRA
jgi:hypothetical protein